MTADKPIVAFEVSTEPDPRFRWVAHREDEADEYHHGYGATEQEARQDLVRIEREQYEAEHPEEFEDDEGR